MRRRRTTEPYEEVELSMTPMLDVVFIMLIFFVVTASFLQPTGIDIDQPEAATAERQTDVQVRIALAADGRIWIDRRPVAQRALRAELQRLHAAEPDAALVIVADKLANTGTLVDIIDAARSVGIAQVAIAAESRATPGT